MASIVVNGDTSGAVTLSSPAVAGTVTVTLPSTSGTMATLTTPSFATTIGVGGATASASGAGITFPATQSASTDVNTLDDYEEGTFTPTLGGASSDPTSVTYVAQAGYYTKIGRLVTAVVQVGFTTYTGGSGNFDVKGLPFTVASISGGISPVGATQIEYVDLSAGYTYALARPLPTTTKMDLQEQGDNVIWRAIQLSQVASSGTGKYINATIIYMTS